MVLIGLGANLPSHVGDPAQTLRAALDRLREKEIRLVAISRFYRSTAWPNPADPAFINAVVRIETDLTPQALLALLHSIETEFGRKRSMAVSTDARQNEFPSEAYDKPNAPRPLDLDLLDYNGVIQQGPPILPHPRMTERNFVLIPLADIAPDWRDPVSSRAVTDLIVPMPPLEAIADF